MYPCFVSLFSQTDKPHPEVEATFHSSLPQDTHIICRRSEHALRHAKGSRAWGHRRLGRVFGGVGDGRKAVEPLCFLGLYHARRNRAAATAGQHRVNNTVQTNKIRKIYIQTTTTNPGHASRSRFVRSVARLRAFRNTQQHGKHQRRTTKTRTRVDQGHSNTVGLFVCPTLCLFSKAGYRIVVY